MLISAVSIAGASPSADTTKYRALFLELPLFDLPYQFDAAKTVNSGNADFKGFLEGYANPGMHLSLDITADLYTGLHGGIGKLFNADSLRRYGFGKRLLFGLALCGADAVTFWCPGFLGWEHEEYHRAVMSRFQVNSYNGMNDFPVGSELVSVTGVRDEDLARFKRESPADFIRMHVSGSEGEYALVERLRRNNFFYDQRLINVGLYYLAMFNSIAYVKMCGMPWLADAETDEANSTEKTIDSRDFTGMDFLGWTYDLFRPDEPYAHRGIHPSGIGINRYIKTTDLTQEQLRYLKKQGNLQLLNLISPDIIGSNRFGLNLDKISLSRSGLFGTLALHHYLTSFGNDISCTVFLRDKIKKVILGIHSFQNYCRSFPAIEVQMLDFERPVFSRALFISPRIMLGIQPYNQGFMTSRCAFLGLAECRFELATSLKAIFNPFVEFSAKSKGWVAGNEFLDKNFSLRCGIASRLFR